jgi:hypothetical protein
MPHYQQNITSIICGFLVGSYMSVGLNFPSNFKHVSPQNSKLKFLWFKHSSLLELLFAFFVFFIVSVLKTYNHKLYTEHNNKKQCFGVTAYTLNTVLFLDIRSM